MFSNWQSVPWVKHMFGAFFSKRSTSLGPTGAAPLFILLTDSSWELLTSGFEPMNWIKGGTRYNTVACKAKEINLQNVSSVWDLTFSQQLLKAENFWDVTPCHLVCTFLTHQMNVVPSASGSSNRQRESGNTQPLTQHNVPDESDIQYFCSVPRMKCVKLFYIAEHKVHQYFARQNRGKIFYWRLKHLHNIKRKIFLCRTLPQRRHALWATEHGIF